MHYKNGFALKQVHIDYNHGLTKKKSDQHKRIQTSAFS